MAASRLKSRRLKGNRGFSRSRLRLKSNDCMRGVLHSVRQIEQPAFAQIKPTLSLPETATGLHLQR